VQEFISSHHYRRQSIEFFCASMSEKRAALHLATKVVIINDIENGKKQSVVVCVLQSLAKQTAITSLVWI